MCNYTVNCGKNATARRTLINCTLLNMILLHCAYKKISMKIYTVKLIVFSLFMAAGIICRAQKRPTTNEGLKTLAIADI